MRALLVRGGVDSEAGNWNGPVDLETSQFVYVAIPENATPRPGLSTPYSGVRSALASFGCSLPAHLANATMHLDPDFEYLTYGEGPKANQLRSLADGDLIVFYAGLEDVHTSRPLVYALIGLYVVDEVVSAASVPPTRWHECAQTRVEPPSDDVVVMAKKEVSGRLDRCLHIGTWRNNAYRVFPELLEAWGELGVKDGWITRNGWAPDFLNPEQFYQWFQNELQRQAIGLVQRNN